MRPHTISPTEIEVRSLAGQETITENQGSQHDAS